MPACLLASMLLVWLAFGLLTPLLQVIVALLCAPCLNGASVGVVVSWCRAPLAPWTRPLAARLLAAWLVVWHLYKRFEGCIA